MQFRALQHKTKPGVFARIDSESDEVIETTVPQLWKPTTELTYLFDMYGFTSDQYNLIEVELLTILK